MNVGKWTGLTLSVFGSFSGKKTPAKEENQTLKEKADSIKTTVET